LNEEFFIYISLFILQNYTTGSKFISFDHQTSWRTTIAVGHSGWSLTVVGHGGNANRRGPPKAVMQPSWATTVVFFNFL
jgi:hypothetical protein